MKLGIINSAFAQVGMDTATGLEHIARIGFDCVDIFTEAMTIPDAEKKIIAETCEREGLPIISLPVVATGLIDFNEPVRDFHVTRCKRFIDLAAEFGAKNILLVLGEYLWQREVIPAEAQWGWAIETCRILGDYADGKNVDIALELEPFRMSFLVVWAKWCASSRNARTRVCAPTSISATAFFPTAGRIPCAA